MTERKSNAVTKIKTGIEGFDAMTRGGIPERRITLLMGGPGSGKTVFALQTLTNGARRDGAPAIFVTFEESSEQILANVASFGWDIEELVDESIFFLDARLSPQTVQSGEFDLGGLLATLKAKAEAVGAKRIAFDAIDVLLASLHNPVAERRELYRLHDWLIENQFTALISYKANGGRGHASAADYGFLQFLVDCVVALEHRLVDRVALRELRIVKYRGSGFAENVVPMVIGGNGITVVNSGSINLDYDVYTERVSTGIERLDTMFSGGYLRGSSVLITGAPGTAKSTLGGIFAEATCLRGEPALFVSFDESANEIVRNLASVDIQLRPHLENGRLRIFSARTQARSAEQHLMHIKTLLDEHRPHSLVIDPLSAVIKAGGHQAAMTVTQRLLYLAKSRGITIVTTSLLQSTQEREATDLQISTMADTWIHLSYQVQGGERNRALTIVKSRGTAHSSQVRELILSSDGLRLADVYTEGGEVLMGTLRREREMAEQRERQLSRHRNERQQQEAALAEAEVRARIDLLRQELEARRAELEYLKEEHALREAYWSEKREEIKEQRRADSGDRVEDG